MPNQNSIISYVPQPYFISGSCSVVPFLSVDSVENGDGLFDPSLSDFVTIVANSGASSFGIRISFDRTSDHLTDTNMCMGFIGCSLITYEDDGSGSPDLDTAFSEDILLGLDQEVGTESDTQISYSHNSQNNINSFCGLEMPGIISGGTVNVMFHGLGKSTTSTTVTTEAIFIRTPADTALRPHSRAIIGHMFVGVELPIIVDPKSFTWSLKVNNESSTARDAGRISSDGTLLRQSSCEIIKIPNENLVGSVFVTTNDKKTVPNFFDLTKVNNSYPILLSPYPIEAVNSTGLTAEQANLTARQNFFSIYGFMDNSFEFQPGEYRDGLDSEYRARFRIRETR